MGREINSNVTGVQTTEGCSRTRAHAQEKLAASATCRGKIYLLQTSALQSWQADIFCWINRKTFKWSKKGWSRLLCRDPIKSGMPGAWSSISTGMKVRRFESSANEKLSWWGFVSLCCGVCMRACVCICVCVWVCVCGVNFFKMQNSISTWRKTEEEHVLLFLETKSKNITFS